MIRKMVAAGLFIAVVMMASAALFPGRAIIVTSYLLRTNNFADVLDTSAARINLGLGTTTSWTPTDASGASLTFSSVSATCTNLQPTISLCRANLTYPATADGSSAKIGGLPFTSTNAAYSGSSCVRIATNVSTFVQVLLVTNGTSLSLLKNNGAALANSDMTGGTVWISCLYTH